MPIIPNLKLVQTQNLVWQLVYTPILSCPFCGGEARYIRDDPHRFNIRTFCYHCGIGTPFLYDSNAIAVWNRRYKEISLDVNVAGVMSEISQKDKDTKTTAELRICPFCGGEADLRSLNTEKFYIVCNQCGVYTPYMKKDKVIMAWNKRYSKRE